LWLRSIEADRFRNLRAAVLALDAGLTVLQGRNGQGKSSILEAAYLLATGKSFRTRTLQDCVSWDGGPATVSGRVSSRSGDHQLGVVLTDGQRQLLADGSERDFENYLGRLAVVDLTVERMKILRGNPDERRRLVDRGMVGLATARLRDLVEYRRLLAHRNALLRRIGPAAGARELAQLAAWDERLAVAGGRVHDARRRYAVQLAAALGPPSRALFPDGQALVVRYQPSPRRAAEVEGGEYTGVLLEDLERHRARDQGFGLTHVGPHRDDLAIELDGVDLRRFGSAGQVRAATVALKLAKLDLLRSQLGETPLFLIDDFDTDLDEPRMRALAAYLRDGACQTLAATSKEGLADRLEFAARVVQVSGGALEG
jgi:DNA replication and repair protein RecF